VLFGDETAFVASALCGHRRTDRLDLGDRWHGTGGGYFPAYRQQRQRCAGVYSDTAVEGV
jgi:hypothetical protein